jgi:hypothetical protein
MNAWLRRLARPPQIIIKQDTVLAATAWHGAVVGCVLNNGSKNVRVGNNCVNFDLVPGPCRVVEQARRALRPGGWLFLDALFLQPDCYDGADLWRFTEDGLRQLCDPYVKIIEVTISIAPFPALAYVVQVAAYPIGNRYVGAALAWIVSKTVWPTRFCQFPILALLAPFCSWRGGYLEPWDRGFNGGFKETRCGDRSNLCRPT